MSYFTKKAPFYYLLLFYLIISLFLRIVLLFHPITQTSFIGIDIIKIFTLGVASDFFIFVITSSLLWVYSLFLSNSKYNKPYGYIIFGCLVLLLIYISFFNTILDEYGGSLPEIGISFLLLKVFLFGLMLFLPKWRKQIRLVLFSITVFIVVLLIVQNAISEFFFWNEFGVRYNFIAVDYLVYTNTVIGNIMESYPVIPLFVCVALVSFIATYGIVKRSKSFLAVLPSLGKKIKNTIIYVGLFIISLFAIPFLAQQEKSQNVFANELQANGLYRFYSAFKNSELDYETFYKTLPNDKAFAILQNQISGIKGNSTLRTIKSDLPENHKNVVLITIESLSAEFLTEYGSTQKLTPFLDSLALESLQFSNFYAVGNRTVRGLEAVTLCLPPTAAESVIKRDDNKNKFSTASVFKQKGYQVKYLYGGDSYFDNMQDFFKGNGYDVIDKKSLLPNEIIFSNIWGVCDEDMANKAIKVMNQEAKTGKPFFNHWMTVSNHRPFTYPERKIEISPSKKWREGGVMYTDYALKQFFKMAKKQSWFNNTVFVILADHCASSSGKTELPIDGYRIPAIIYAPGFIKPTINTTLVSQIDIMPTLFGLLNFSYKSKFYGQDVLKLDYKPRALIATYQDLGLLKNDILTVLSPAKKVKQYSVKLIPKQLPDKEFKLFYEEIPIHKLRKDLVDETISYYQTASKLLKEKNYQK